MDFSNRGSYRSGIAGEEFEDWRSINADASATASCCSTWGRYSGDLLLSRMIFLSVLRRFQDEVASVAEQTPADLAVKCQEIVHPGDP